MPAIIQLQGVSRFQLRVHVVSVQGHLQNVGLLELSQNVAKHGRRPSLNNQLIANLPLC